MASTSTIPFSARVAGITGSEIDQSISLLQEQTHDVIRFGIGSPGLDAIPRQLASLLADVGDAAAGAFDYGPTEGDAWLRAALLPVLRRTRPRLTDAELLITAGGMQGLDLAAKLFIDPDDLVVVESPTYTNGAAVITSYQGQLLEVPVDQDGMDVAGLVELLGHGGQTPKAIYTIPNFQNPAGVTLSLERRKQLVDLAEQWGSVIVEDDPYGELGFGDVALPSLASLAEGRAVVVGVNTFSKTLAPGLRVGWMTAPAEVIAKMVDARQGMDTCTNVPLQRVAAEMIRSGAMDEHLAGLRTLYRRRRDVMLDALEQEFGNTGAHWTEPGGGFFIWLTLPDGVDTAERYSAALAGGVAYIPGAAFTAVPGRFRSALRLCYATTPAERIHEGVHRLREVMQPMVPASRELSA